MAEGGKIGNVAGPSFEVIEYSIKKYAGWLPITNELLSDSDANLTNTLIVWLGGGYCNKKQSDHWNHADETSDGACEP